MELDITDFFLSANPRYYSASAAELGDDAGRITWENAVDAADEWILLKDEETRQAFRDFVREFGAWSDDEISAWSDVELNALCLQFISGDIRESGLADGGTWEQYAVDAESGRVSSRLFRDDAGRVYFDIGN